MPCYAVTHSLHCVNSAKICVPPTPTVSGFLFGRVCVFSLSVLYSLRKEVLTMKFDVDCAREILLTLEAKEYDCSMSFVELNNSLPSFSSEPLTVQYTCLKLEEMGYIKLERKFFGSRSSDFIEKITDVTAAGHEYLSQLRIDKQPYSDNTNSDVKAPAKKSKKNTIKTAIELIAAIFGIAGTIFAVIEFFQ